MCAVTRGHGLLEGFLARQRARKADELIPSSHRTGCILDLGCGSYPLFLLQTRFASKIGLDATVGTGLAAFSDAENVQFIRHDFGRDLPLPVDALSCDAVTMLAVIEHLEPVRVPDLLAEIHRVLKPGGLLVITTPARWTDRLLRFMARVGLVSDIEIREHKAAYSHGMLVRMLEPVFGRKSMSMGYFELSMNLWALARKPD